MPALNPWNAVSEAMLRRLWGEGKSARECARILGNGITREAVCGKARRLGLAHRKSGPQAAPKKRTRRNPRTRTIEKIAPRINIEPIPPSAPDLVVPAAERKGVQHLTEESCRWPIGDPQMADFHFCNKDHVPGLPYCEFHARRAFQPPWPIALREFLSAEPASPEDVSSRSLEDA